jgi:hypothetical protein
VSPDGLVATSHRCVTAALELHARPDRNLLRDGFVARTRSEELPAGPGTRAHVTVSVRDVTQAIAGRIDPRLGDAERGRLLELRTKERIAACERPGIRCTVTPFFEGARWLEIAQLELSDMRLVFAPPLAVGRLGGDRDEGEWPRHAGDFALLRAWVRPDGRPAPFDAENVPYAPPRWLPLAPGGAAEGELVLAAGHPAATQRLRTHAEVREQLGWAYPRTIRRTREMLAVLGELSRASRETGLRLSERVRTLARTLKTAEATLEDAARRGLLAQKADAERELGAWIEADATRRAEYGDVLARLDALQAARERTRERDAAFAALYEDSAVLAAARAIRRLAAERPKRDLDRLPEFQARNWPRLREALERLGRTLDLAADRTLLRHAVLEAAALPAAQRIAPLDAAVGLAPGLGAEDAARKVDGWLDGLYAGTRLADPAVRLGLLDASPQVALSAQDPFLALDAALQPVEETLRAEGHAYDGARSRHAPRWARALLERAGGLLAPDANGTLRVTSGVVKGGSPRDGLEYRSRSTLEGVLEKDRAGDPDVDVPAAVEEAIRAEHARRTSPHRDARLGDVPVDFLATLDATPGAAGWPIVNARGELVGVAFDTLSGSAASDLVHDPERTRSIGVDVRYLLWFLSEVSGATHLLEELSSAAPAVGAR